ncbi:MAG: AAA family ATPase [Cyanophyceae cyanobacterium]
MADRAEQFREAFQNLQLQPLLTKEDRDRFRVPYGAETLDEWFLMLEDCTPANNQFIVAGHRGCGKSTLLAEFAEQIEGEYFTVFFSIADLVERYSIDHITILFTIGIQLLEKAVENDLAIEQKIEQKFKDWFKDRVTIEETSVAMEGKVGANFFGWIKGEVKSNSQVQEQIKTTFTRNPQDLIETINNLAREITVKAKRPIVMIIDDLDKLDLDQVKQIFYQNLKLLLEPYFTVIYTIPIATIRDADLKTYIESETNNSIRVVPV